MKTCEARSAIYKKIFSALDDSYPAKKEAAEIMTLYAVQNRVDPSLNAWQIIQKSREISAINGIRAAQAAKQQSKEEDPSGVPDKKYLVSGYPDKASCISGLVKDLNIDPQRAEEECSTQFGPGKGTVNAKTRKAVMNNLISKYPNLSRKSANYIVDQTIREHNIKSASVESSVEVPYFVTVSDIDTSHLQNATPADSPHLKSASLDEKKAYFDAITEGMVDVLRNKTVRRDSESKIKSAKLKEKSDSEKPAWAKVTGNL